jgi:hypothetical protein
VSQTRDQLLHPTETLGLGQRVPKARCVPPVDIVPVFVPPPFFLLEQVAEGRVAESDGLARDQHGVRVRVRVEIRVDVGSGDSGSESESSPVLEFSGGVACCGDTQYRSLTSYAHMSICRLISETPHRHAVASVVAGHSQSP